MMKLKIVTARSDLY